MSLVGDLVSLIVSLAQEISIVVGVGAVTMTLVGHLLSLHAHKNETVFGYVRAARSIRALALAAIIISGGVAILIHVQSETLGIFLAPAFLFKWLLIGLLAAFYFMELKVEGVWRDAVEGFEGANWYALFIVHTLAPVVGWMQLLAVYAGWLATFAAIWVGFVWVMRRESTIKPKPKPASKAAPVVPLKPVAAPVAPKPTPAPMPVPPPAPAPVPVVPKTIPVPGPRVEIHPNHSILPMVAELDLPAPKHAATAAPAPVAPEPPKPPVQMLNLEESGLPALHVMPKRPEDIESSKRGPVVKMSDE